MNTTEKRKYRFAKGLRYSTSTHTLTLVNDEKFYLVTKGKSIYVTDEQQEVFIKLKPESVAKLVERSVKLKPKVAQPVKTAKKVLPFKKSQASANAYQNRKVLIANIKAGLKKVLDKRPESHSIPYTTKLDTASDRFGKFGVQASVTFNKELYADVFWYVHYQEFRDPYMTLILRFPVKTGKETLARIAKQPVFKDFGAVLTSSAVQWSKKYNLNFKTVPVQHIASMNVGETSGELLYWAL